MIIGNIDKFKGTGLVAYLDLLGFSNEIENKWSNVEDNPLDKILLLKKNIPQFTSEELKELSPNKNQRTYLCRVQTISDSIIVSFGLEKPCSIADIVLGIIVFIETISSIWVNTLVSGFTLRGAVDMGEIYWDDKEIIGPALIKTYQLEKDYAKTSRIIISSSFNKNLAKLFSEKQTLWNDKILQLLRLDIDGYLIVNPHNLYSYKVDNNEVIDTNELINCIIEIQKKAKGFVKEKYTPLLCSLNMAKFNLTKENLGNY